MDINIQRINVNGADLPLKGDINISFSALEKFDPFYDPEPAPQQIVHTVEFDYVREEIVIRW